MEKNIALAVQDMHSSCSETTVRAFSRVRPVIPAVLSTSFRGSALSGTGMSVIPSTTGFAAMTSTGFAATGLVNALGYGKPQTDATRKDVPSGYQTWSPPV